MEEDKEQMIEKIRIQEEARKAQEEKISKLMNMVVVSRSVAATPEETDGMSKKARQARRETWCPGEGKLGGFQELGLSRPPKPFYMDKNLKKPQKKVQVEAPIEEKEVVQVIIVFFANSHFFRKLKKKRKLSQNLFLNLSLWKNRQKLNLKL